MKPTLILIAWTLLSVSATPTETPKAVPPDVYLITIDTLRADRVHCYGDDRIATPAIDSLAQAGIRFSQAFTPSPITNTSHTTILTGLLPSSHGVTDFGLPLAASHSTMAELLAQRGYHSGAFIGAVILDSNSLAPGLNRGFDFYDNFPEHSTSKERWGRVERRGAEVVRHAEAWLTAHPRGPHFVWLHLYDPHDPYEPPAPYSETYKDRLYDGEIAYADSVLGNFLTYLKTHGWYQNSLIIVVGDHGEGLGEHHEDTHGIFLYDSTTHVPLIIKLPRESAHRVVDAQVRNTDILPTVLEIVHAASPAHLDGQSLVPYFTGETGDRIAIGETDYPLRFGWAPLRSVRAEGFKFIDAPRPELYDLHVDPTESKNTYAAASTQVEKSLKLLAQLGPKASPATSGATENNAAQLHALGYQSSAESGAQPSSNTSALPDPKDKIEEQNLLHRAMMATDLGRSDDARTSLQQVLVLNPKSPVALRQLGELELDGGHYDKAASHLKAAREVRPEDATVAYDLGRALEKTGDDAGARDALEASLKLLPGQLQARILLGGVYLRLKNLPAAEDQFEAALLLDPNNADANAGLAKVQAAKQ